MKAIIEHLFEFGHHLPWSDETKLEETSIYLFLKEETLSIQPKRDYFIRYSPFFCALRILAIEFFKEDNHGFASASSVQEQLQEKVEALSAEDCCSLSDYFGLYRKLREDYSDTNYFLTADYEERINFFTVCSQITACLINEIELELTRLKVYLMYGIRRDRWHKMYQVNDTYHKERIDMIVNSILG